MSSFGKNSIEGWSLVEGAAEPVELRAPLSSLLWVTDDEEVSFVEIDELRGARAAEAARQGARVPFRETTDRLRDGQL